MSSVSSQVKKVFKSIENDLAKARVQAMNKSAVSALSHTLKEFRQSYNVKLKDLKKITSIEKAERNKERIVVKFLDKSLGLEYFSPSKGKNKRGISATVKRGHRKLYKSTFYVKVNSRGHNTIFKRSGKARLPIERMFGANPTRIITTDKSVEKMTDDFYKIFEKNFDRLFNHYFN